MSVSAFRLPQQRRLVTELPGPGSRALAERRAVAVAAGVGSTMPVFAADADGGIVVDVDGNALIDLGAGIAVTGVGAAHPKVAAAVAAQAGRFTHTCFMVTPYEGYVAVAERLNALTPGTHDKRTVLVNSGAEAVENAVKIARAATGRSAVVSFDNGYHGRTNLTMALTAKAMPYKHGFGPFAAEVYRVPGSYPVRDGLGGAEAAARAITMIDRQIGGDQVAAIIYEPIQGEGGFIVPAPGFLPAIADYARRNGIVFIADEIQTGLARTGTMFACDHEQVVPDLITTAKALAGGLPLAAVTGRAELLDAVHAGGLGGTYGGNPIACAAALAALAVIEDEDLAGAARGIEQTVHAVLGPVADRTPAVLEIRGRGAMMAVEFADPDTLAPRADLATAVADRARAAGVITLTCGTDGNVLRLLPPLVIGTALLEEGLSEIAAAIEELA